MNFATMLSIPVKSLQQRYSNEIDTRVKNARDKRKEIERTPEVKVAPVTIEEEAALFKAATMQQFQAIDLRFAFGYSAQFAGFKCKQMVQHGFARLIGQTKMSRHKPRNIYEWV